METSPRLSATNARLWIPVNTGGLLGRIVNSLDVPPRTDIRQTEIGVVAQASTGSAWDEPRWESTSAVPLVSGSETITVAPPSGLLTAHIRPRCSLTMVRQMERPSPRPSRLVVTNGSNIVVSASWG